MSDGIAPNDRIREINPDGLDVGGRRESTEFDDHDGDHGRTFESHSRFSTHPRIGRGTRFVTTTTGAPTPTPATVDAASAPRSASRDWLAPEAGTDDEANREARGVAGFRTANRHANVAMSNPSYQPSRMYKVAEPTAPPAGEPWYRRLAIIIPVVVALAAALFAGIGLPAIAQAQATAGANEAAREFTQSLEEYRAAWTSENLDALSAASPHLGIGDAANALQQPLDAQATLTQECTAFADATRAAAELADNPPPALAVLPSSSFSAAYRDAQSVDAAFATERSSAQATLAAVSATIAPLAALCTNFQAGVAIENRAALRDEQELAPLRTVPFGAVVEVGGRSVTCAEAVGCVDYADDDARAGYAAAWRSIHEERALALIAHYRDACWLDVLRPYCTLMSDAWDAAKAGIAAISSAMATEQPARDPAQGDFPRLAQAQLEQATAFESVVDTAKLEAGAIDPATLVDVSPGWETWMLTRMVAAYEAHLDAAVADYRSTASS